MVANRRGLLARPDPASPTDGRRARALPTGGDRGPKGRGASIVAVLVVAGLLVSAIPAVGRGAGVPPNPSGVRPESLSHAAPSPGPAGGAPGDPPAAVAEGAGSGVVPDGGNSSPLGLIGTVVGHLMLPGSVMQGTYDPANGYLYVPSGYGTSLLSIVNGTSLVKTLTVGIDPELPTYDPLNGYVYVPNWSSGNVTVLNGTQVVGNLKGFGNPELVIFDPANGDLYVLDYSNSGLHIIRGTSYLGNVTLSSGAFSGTYDPDNQALYIATISGGVVIVQDTKIIGTISASYTYSPVWDPVNGYVYVSDYSSGAILVLNGTQEIATVAVSSPYYLSVDPRTGFVYEAGFFASSIAVINGTKVVGTISVSGGGAMAFDRGNGYLYTVNGSRVTAL
ncbi:MAG TPA: hypothetical protein VLY85_00820, partial [Thermoplasmata archaeon]|nr:hypothetical protein [Thermoplasmata archaeon]